MCDFFDDGFGIEEFAIALGLADEIAEEERERLKLLQDEAEDMVEDDDVAWYERG